MRKIVVIGAAAILSLGVGGTALAASNGFGDSGVSVRPVSTTSPSHDVGDDHGGDRPRGVNDDGASHDASDASDANDDHGGDRPRGVNDDHGDDHGDDRGGDRRDGHAGNSGPGSANSGHGGHDHGDDHGDDHGGR